MTWSINASGHTGDVAKEQEMIGRIAGILAEPEYGTGHSQASSSLGLVNNFHVPEDRGDVGGEAAETNGQQGGLATSESGDSPVT